DLQKLIVELKLDSSQVILLQNHINSLVPINLLQHWSVNDPDDFKKYYEVVRDVKNFFLSNSLTFTMLDEIALRHQERNSLYHDHKQSGLSINDDKCLRALCGMFDLMEQLFPGSPTTDSFLSLAQRNKTVRCQIGVLRLKLSAHGSTELEEPYLADLRQFNKEHKITIDSKNFEHSVLHTISERFFIAIESHLGSKVDVLQKKLSDQITKLGQMHTDNQISQQRAKIADSEHQVTVLSEQLAIIKGLIATP
ncbi:hypothetical protein JZU68_05220, partial [bacterium]|nr:hypothetical protein [bacterium]